MATRLLPSPALALTMAWGCSLSPVDLTGKACPCASGWRCDPETLTCRPGLIPDGGVLPDGRVVVDGRVAEDAGGGDAGRSDTDAGPGSDSGTPADGGAMETDGGTDAGTPPSTTCTALSSRSDVLFCDGFEASDLSPWRERPDTGTIEVSTSTVHMGDQALRARTTTSEYAGRSDVASPAWTPLTTGDLYQRAWFYVPSGFVSDNLGLLVSSEDMSPYHGHTIHFRTGDRIALWSGAGSVSQWSTLAVPRDRWFCLQVHVQLHETAGSYEVKVDGTTFITVNDVDTSPSRGYRAIGVGITWTDEMQEPATVLVDEVAVATEPLSCD